VRVHAPAPGVNLNDPAALADHHEGETAAVPVEVVEVAVRPEIQVDVTLEAVVCHYAHAFSMTSGDHVASAQLDPLAASMRKRALSLMTASSE
jgi:hypothetical protein